MGKRSKSKATKRSGAGSENTNNSNTKTKPAKAVKKGPRPAPKTPPREITSLLPWKILMNLLRFAALVCVAYVAVYIRLNAVFNYGKVIHEFDPWFNYRATQQLVREQRYHGYFAGITRFFNWYDTKVWSPLGRPVGQTIFPGMQLTASSIYWTLKRIKGYYPRKAVRAAAKPVLAFLARHGVAMAVPRTLNIPLNDICVFIPAGFGALSALFTAGLATEVSGSGNVGVVAAAIMAVIPAHLMRSVAGGYDNESVAVSAICATFYLWLRSLRRAGAGPAGAGAASGASPGADAVVAAAASANRRTSLVFGVLSGVSYAYMAAAWGGYVFVINMVGVHAALLCLLGRFTPQLHVSYSLFYVIGTLGALQVPIIGWAPLKSMEQMGPLLVFLGLQVLAALRAAALSRGVSPRKLQWGLYALSGLGLAIVASLFQNRAALWAGYTRLVDRGVVWDVTTRIKSLFIVHTKTGNPLVDSVAEHQSTPASVYVQYLHHTFYAAPLGFALCALSFLAGEARAAWGTWAEERARAEYGQGEESEGQRATRYATLHPHADGKLFLLAYCLAAGYFANTMIRLVLVLAPAASCAAAYAIVVPVNWGVTQMFKRRNYLLLRLAGLCAILAVLAGNHMQLPLRKHPWKLKVLGKELQFPRPSLSLAKYRRLVYTRRGGGKWKLRLLPRTRAREFYDHCVGLAEQLSEPQIMMRGKGHNGKPVMIDDFREGYWWLRDNTPEDARVMAWWDYGYQITGIGNRTTIADGNTWNHEHIALLGRCLVSSEVEGHRLIRHLADYVLLWTTRYAGSYGDDLAKSPHMARIAGSVYKDIHPQEFYLDRQGNPSPMMQRSVLFRLHSYRLDPRFGKIKLRRFQEVYTTKNRMMRIYKVLSVDKKSKAHPFGKYPPKLHKTIKKGLAFSEQKRRHRLKIGKFD